MKYDSVLKCLNKNGYLLQHISNQNEELCIAAVNEDGLVLQFVKRQTEKICKSAVNKNARAARYVNSKFIHLFKVN